MQPVREVGALLPWKNLSKTCCFYALNRVDVSVQRGLRDQEDKGE